jgi:predicted acyltransferase
MNNPALVPNPVRRLLSLDVLRGLTIAFMIMVNNNGGRAAWAEMHHADWNGFTATDLVFPTFLFCVGASIVFATEARLAKGVTRGKLVLHTVQRAVILCLLGIVVNNFPYFHLEHMRFYGVLPRIAVCYLVIGLFYLVDRRVSTKVALLFVVLIGYWVLVRFVPVLGAGVPGRDVAFLDKDQNIVAWLDRQLMPGHLYEDYTTHNTRDPEGLLSDIPALGTTLLGMLAALWLRSQRELKAKAFGLVIGSASLLTSGYIWSIWFPLNKKMWTSTFVLVAAGWSMAILALAYWLVEIRGWGKAKSTGRQIIWPWLVFGSNAIAAYMVSEIIPGINDLFTINSNGTDMTPLWWTRVHLFGIVPNPGWACFAYSFSYMAVCFIPVWILYRNKIFIKV